MSDAILGNNPEIVRTVLQKGLKIPSEPLQLALLNFAIPNGKVKTLRDLCELGGVSISELESSKSTWYWSSLVQAITCEILKKKRKKLREVVEYLCKQGAEVEKRDC